MTKEVSALEKARFSYKPKLPESLKKGAAVGFSEGEPTGAAGDELAIKDLFPNTFGSPMISFEEASGSAGGKALNVGVILSGGQAPGGHNVIAGIFDGIKSINAGSRLYGFLGGPGGLVDNEYIEIDAGTVEAYRNTGGFDMIGSGRTKLEKAEQFEKARENCEKLGVEVIVIVGGDDSNTNACLLAEYYMAKNIPIQVIGCPKTIDGDLKNEYIEASFGFDTACRVYSELIGNICRDANSAKKYWHFIRLMGRSASHIALECALQTHPNVALIGEEVAEKEMTLNQIVDRICDIIIRRSETGSDYGIALVPEGLIEFIPEMRSLIADLNDLLAEEEPAMRALGSDGEKLMFVNSRLSGDSSHVFSSLPNLIQKQLILDRDPHGNVQVSLIETEKLIVEMIKIKIKELAAEGSFKGKFKTQCHFFGYEGRCAAPSNFDADYCYGLGYSAAALAGGGKSGYMASVRNLAGTPEEWTAGGIPITMMMNMERRHGEDKPVIRKALVDLEGSPFRMLESGRAEWAMSSEYIYPGPIQYFGPSEVCDLTSLTLALECGK